MSLATQVLLGFLLGVVSGIFFGDLIAPVGIIGDAFIRLLQMTVMPYVVVSLILGLGQLSAANAGLLIRRAGALLLLLWAVSLAFVLMMPLAYPNWEASSYFSTTLLEPTPKLDLVRLFIPANPFHSLANGVVPATVVFSLAMGAALIVMESKQSILNALSTLSDALSRVAKFVVRLAPLGVVAITVRAAGTLELQDLQSLEVYLAVYLVFWSVMALWFLPMLVAALTPLNYREIMGPARDALVTAFATGSAFVVLPILADHSKELVRRCTSDSDDTTGAVDVLVPLAFTFPGPGTLLILGFIPFAAWTAGVTITTGQLPAFLGSGLMSLFGHTMVAVPFLLDQLRIPADLFQLYVVGDVFTGRFSMLISSIFMLTFSALGACALSGAVRIQKQKLVTLVSGTAVLLLAGILSVQLIFTHLVSHEYSAGQAFLDRELLFPSEPLTQSDPETFLRDQAEGGSTLAMIRDRGTIRVGYRASELPFSFKNSAGQLVGFDIDLAHLLAADLGVSLEFVPVTRGEAAGLLSDGTIDIVMSGFAVTPGRAVEMAFSVPYLDQTLAFVVPDHRRNEFSTSASVKSLRGLNVAVPDLPYLKQQVAAYLDDEELVTIESPRNFFESSEPSWDALVYSAEAGSAWTLLHPEYSVVIPQPDVVRIPIAYPVAQGNDSLRNFLNTWIEFKRRDRTLDRLYDHWILGKPPEHAAPRWSVIRDVLGWVE